MEEKSKKVAGHLIEHGLWGIASDAGAGSFVSGLGSLLFGFGTLNSNEDEMLRNPGKYYKPGPKS